MKSFFLFSFTCFFPVIIFGQIAVDMSKNQKVVQNGAEITMFEGKPLSGYLTESYPNGKPKTWITVRNGIANGQWQEWFESGNLRYNAYWKEGKGHGLWQYFHENGTLKYEESYILDISNGISRTYYNNGKLQHDFFYLNGKKDGVWKYYSETGILVKTEHYGNDVLMSSAEK